MAPDEPRKGLWGRVKGALGVPEEDEDELASRPQVTSTFTASRLPSGDGGPVQPRLFPAAGRSSSAKWELYEDSWDELSTAQNPDLGPTDMWVPEPEGIGGEPHEPPVDEWPPPEPPDLEPPDLEPPDLEPTDLEPTDLEPTDLEPADLEPAGAGPEATDEWLAPIPAAPWEPAGSAPSRDDAPLDLVADDLSEALEALVGDPGDDDVLAHLDTDDVAALARAVGYTEPDPDERPAPSEPRPVPAAAEHQDPAPTAEHHDPARVAAPSPRADAPTAAPADPPAPTWRPQPDLDAVRPEAHGDLFSVAPHEVRDRLLSATPGSASIAPRTTTPSSLDPHADGDDPGGSQPAEIQHDIGAERQIAVHEQRLEAAIARARHKPPPTAKVYDERLHEPAPPQAMNPSEALALAQRGRSAIGPRDDVAPAS